VDWQRNDRLGRIQPHLFEHRRAILRGYTNRHANANTNSYADPNPNSNDYGDCHSNSDCYFNSNTDFHTEAYAHAKAHTDSEAASDSCASPVVNLPSILTEDWRAAETLMVVFGQLQ
jgi:hypothetical protein